MRKAFRQTQIRKIITGGRVTTQEDLGEKLAELGIPTTQATLSRDIRELGILKTAQGYRESGAATSLPRPRENLRRVFQEFLRDVQTAQNIVVIKTNPGSANTVALALDAENWLEIIGTVAGDDTIFAATAGPAAAKKLRQRLLSV
jgi:transcriptional regulator of arginine metabolism